ncbi:MAG: putative glycosyltransferase [Candidatus Collierbacteria bacterium GW2011_GWB1_44_6]|uniref:Putative glycosyltransferase n=2 Tax=Candidatus Collieribacteriota TaxID=1752725 RepID=A0A0G1JQX8_9BACT|nr:MAG: putative glycosyltransferase [Candidatus Collierbacteria bacterium GW2011_GWC2_43_12]KKT73840.1 MAG: putative glycosyltransferase [Candidatus Collierbacteria bacterium GW2011_GWB1_44_6]KKT84128.1 MAG: glycosyl transferase family protein [Microgenomates group bacterium GW2011_GWC1_44_9]
MSKKISAIILNYKHPEDTIHCIQALMKADMGQSLDYYIVDNSPDAEVEKEFKKKFPKVHYISSPTNPGFAAGNNKAIRKGLKSGCEYFLIINPDATVNHRFFVPLLRHFKDKSVGIVAPTVYHTQKGKKIYGLEGKVDWKYAKPEHRNLSKVKNLGPITAEFVTFACVLISKDTFKKAGLLDEGYFMYFEDVDYCLSAGKEGKKIILDPSVIVSHCTSSSFKKPTQKLFISFKSHLRFIKKWLPTTKRLIPYLYALMTYPYLYLLWTYHGIKYRNV